MDDLASVIGSALGKPPKTGGDPAAGSGIVKPSEQMADTKFADGSASGPGGSVADLQKAIATAPTPEAKQVLTQELAKIQGGSEDVGGLGDLTSVVSSALNAPAQAAAAPKAVIAPAKTAAPGTEQPGVLASIGAGAGKAMGTGALALQQIAGKGASLLGDTFGSDTIQKAGAWLQSDAKQGLAKLESENAPYAEANPKSNMGGEIAGMVASPINKLVPGFGGPAASLTGAIAKGAAQGAILNTLTAPITDDTKPFLQEKVRQAFVGGIGGAAGGAVGHTLIGAISKGVDAFKGLANRVRAGNPAATADELVTSTLAKEGIDKTAVTPELFDGIKSQVQDAIASGKSVDPKALTRLAQAQTLPVPVPMLKGQITRDAMQFAKEQNLRGIKGVGEPITETLTAQNRALISNLDALGASKGTDVVSAGKSAIDTLVSADAKAQQVVSGAYDAFKNATGKELDVPLQSLAQDYAKTIGDFGDVIPGAVRSKFEALGLMNGKAQKTFSITDAENLIKTINKNYDPLNKPAAAALGELRRGVQSAIADGAGSSAQGAEAAFLAKSAREAAKLRFGQIEATPALKDALRGAEPDKFIQKHILQGNEAQIGSMVDVLKTESPAALEGLQDALMTHIKANVLNGKTAENGIFSQDKMNRFVNDPNVSARLTQVLGPEKMAVLRQLNRVAENALYAPKAAAVNTSNTASAAANLINEEVKGGALNKMLQIGSRVPGLSTAASLAQGGVQSGRASRLIDESVNPSLSAAPAGRAPLADLVRLGSRAGSAYAEQKSAKRSQQ